MTASTPPARTEADRWANRVKFYVGIAGGVLMLVIALTRKDLTLGVVAYGFLAAVSVDAVPENRYRAIATAVAALYVAYMVVDSGIRLPGELDNLEALPPALTPLVATWASLFTHSIMTTRAARNQDTPGDN